jgi:hypothetical protein
MRRRIVMVALVSVAMLGLYVGGGASHASAASNGQQLALRDVLGKAYSAEVAGDNQSCQLTYYYINNWSQHDYDIGGWWWQSWSSCSPYYTAEVYTWSGINRTGTQNGSYGLNGPPHSQTNNWWTCEVDGGSACGAGENIYG